ncbi:MAG: DNA methyltransferase [Candidatus Bipolaricaulia bacterium]
MKEEISSSAFQTKDLAVENLREVLMAQGLNEDQANSLIAAYSSSSIDRLSDPKMKAPRESQLSLFPQIEQDTGGLHLSKVPEKGESVLQHLLQQDLGFKGQTTTYTTHNIHAFAAKFPPQLPRLFIEGLTRPGEVVLDPMVGSGTTLVETLLRGRVGIGFDLDPLAILLNWVKITRLDPKAVQQAGTAVLKGVQETLNSSTFDAEAELRNCYSKKVIEFFHYWFLEKTRQELVALLQEIEKYPSLLIRNLLTALFSSIIITKSGGVSLARDLAHSRPHKDPEKRPQKALVAFQEKLTKVLADFAAIEQAPGRAFAFQADARALPMKENTVDLIVTSPPYANAIDYVRAHKFSLFWLDHAIEELQTLRRETIGAEVPDEEASFSSPTIHKVIREVKEKDPRKAGILTNYFRSMEAVIKEMYRVLRPGKAAIIVVGPSTTRGITVPTQLGLAEIGEATGLQCTGIKEREIDRDKRLMPWSQAKGDAGIEARIHAEYVIALSKPTEGVSTTQSFRNRLYMCCDLSVEDSDNGLYVPRRGSCRGPNL